MVDAALAVLPAGAAVLAEQIAWSRMALFSRIEALPVDFGH